LFGGGNSTYQKKTSPPNQRSEEEILFPFLKRRRTTSMPIQEIDEQRQILYPDCHHSIARVRDHVNAVPSSLDRELKCEAPLG
jgi:hypothetical protein